MTGSGKPRKPGKSRAKANPQKPGRKQWAPTKEQRDLVRLLASMNISETVISDRLGISPPTLRKHCMIELTEAHQAQRAIVIEQLAKRAAEGSVTALKYLHDRLTISAAARSVLNEEPKPAVQSTDRRVGKKQAQADAARRAMSGESSGEWGSDLKPGTMN
jgi:predicted ArsR family transcriptional regulator